jgi:hypothetical protein
MGSTAVVVGAKSGADSSLVAVQGWAAGDYPSLGEPEEVRAEFNERISAAGIASRWCDESSGVLLPDGVEAISFSVYAGLVRSIWITRPTGQLLEILCRWGLVTGWRVFDADSETVYFASGSSRHDGDHGGVR